MSRTRAHTASICWRVAPCRMRMSIYFTDRFGKKLRRAFRAHLRGDSPATLIGHDQRSFPTALSRRRRWRATLGEQHLDRIFDVRPFSIAQPQSAHFVDEIVTVARAFDEAIFRGCII